MSLSNRRYTTFDLATKDGSRWYLVTHISENDAITILKNRGARSYEVIPQGNEVIIKANLGNQDRCGVNMLVGEINRLDSSVRIRNRERETQMNCRSNHRRSGLLLPHESSNTTFGRDRFRGHQPFLDRDRGFNDAF